MERSNRKKDELREVSVDVDFNAFAEGSCLFRQGKTMVLCTATVERAVPAWKSEADGGWITAEYAMLPRANRSRSAREAKQGKQSGRTMEIQRLIGRALRAAVDLRQLPGLTVTLDCDVLQADGGTRCASITAAYIAFVRAMEKAVKLGYLDTFPEIHQVAAVSVGKKEGTLLLDLDYMEDSSADVDLNLVMMYPNQIVEIQGTSEGQTFDQEELGRMVQLGQKGLQELFVFQKDVLGTC